uniref:7SK snRNA methylphosphate capping enzyme-like n=1 Tax=Styela clava TaxID=7725 RepID=UPI0019398C77|nr:7SK snRNA methylphosphate capping enzyme-like [Styela clava]
MATVQTLSPSSEGRCILQLSNTDTIITNEQDFLKNDNGINFSSAPEFVESEENVNQIHQAGNRGRARRRKRRNSFNEHSNMGSSCNHQNGKRRRGNCNHHNHHKRQLNAGGRIILPNKFLLGGNIADPLNLNSMMDENVCRALNAVTPASSPLPPRNSTVDIVMPTDVTDPLGLNVTSFGTATIVPGEISKQKGKKKRRRKSHATKQQEHRQNSDATSNSDDQKDIGGKTPPTDLTTYIKEETSKKTDGRIKKKQHSPPEVNTLNLPATQAHIRDPIVSPVVPQDTRRFRSTISHKNRRQRRSGFGKPSTSDAGMQTDSSVILEEHLRCGSEKIPDRNIFSPPKRRRTVSENFIPALYWNDDDGKGVRIRSFHHSPVKKDFTKDFKALLVKPICGRLAEEEANAGKSPAQNYMNKEIRYEQEKDQTAIQTSNITSKKQSNYEPNQNFTNHKTHNNEGMSSQSNNKKPSKRPQTAHFQYGNYNKYYGYRNPEKFKDIRMENLKKDWFKDKDVLDIGCNAGHLTLLIARDYEPRKIVGIDIDDSLIRTARNNIRHYASARKSSTKFPSSMAISFGPLACPPIETGKDETTAAFPNNINFFQGNYIPQKDEFLRFQEPEYDVVMCMSVSKWVHLNWGDEGLIRMFKRVFKQLRAGGMFILEPQQWNSYKSKRKLSEKLNENFKSIKLFPESFPNLLLKEIGFEKVDHLNLQARNKNAGFQRPIQVYYKPE